MDESDDSHDCTTPTERDGDDGATDPARTQSEDRTYGPEDGAYDPETVESTVGDVEGVEYEGGNVAGAAPTSDLGPVEPETPTLEGALFVLLGVVFTLVVLARLVGF